MAKLFHTTKCKAYTKLITVLSAKYSITCIQRPPKGRNKSGLLQQVVLTCRFYEADLRMSVVSNTIQKAQSQLLLMVKKEA